MVDGIKIQPQFQHYLYWITITANDLDGLTHKQNCFWGVVCRIQGSFLGRIPSLKFLVFPWAKVPSFWYSLYRNQNPSLGKVSNPFCLAPQSVVHGPAASASLGHVRKVESQALPQTHLSQNLHLNKSPEWCICTKERVEFAKRLLFQFESIGHLEEWGEWERAGAQWRWSWRRGQIM